MSQSIADLTAHKRSFDNGFQFAWDATSIELYQTCPRKYYLSMIEGWTPRATSVHLIFGGIYASALENFYKHRAIGDSLEDALRKIIREALVKSFEKEFDHKAKTRENLIRTIVWYIEQFGDETGSGITTHHLQDGSPAVELSFTVEANDEYLFCGHMDRGVRFQDEIYGMDQKTTGGTVGPYFFNQFSPNNQMSLYTWAGKILFSTPLKGMIIDAAQIAVNFTRFERGFTTRTKGQLEEWYTNTLLTFEEVRASTESGNFRMNLSACGNYGGCPFRSICKSDPSVRNNFLKSDYVSHNWDPVEAR